MKIITYYLTILMIFSCSCIRKNHELSKKEMLAIVEKQNTLLSICFTDGDVDKLADMYTDSAKLSPNGYHFVYGRDSIKAFWAEDFKTSKVIEMNTEILSLDGNVDVIYETGKANSKIIYNDSVNINVHVKYINVWRKQKDGSYKLDVDFWNKDLNISN